MTRVILLAVVVAEILDLVTWMAMPRAAEVNPLAQGLHTPIAWLLKGLVVVAAPGVLPALSDPAIQEPVHGHRVPAWVYAEVRDLVIVVAIYAGITGFGSNVTVLAYVASVAAPGPATQPAPMPSAGTGNEQGTMVLAAESRTPAPRQSAPGASVRGLASWYGVNGDVAAAGPALRHGHWRGSFVQVCADRCVTVRLVDWCQCYRGQRSERVIDLSPSAFARIAPLSAGVVRVTVSRVHVTPPATDTE